MIQRNYAIGYAALALLLAFPAAAQPPTDTPKDAPTEKTATVPDVSARNEMIYRANLGRADDVKLLVEQGGSANQLTGEGVPVLCLASARKDEEGKNVVEMLVKLGADINARDRKGQTALFYAARAGNLDTVNYLLTNKIDLYAIDNNGDIARSVAFASGHKEVLLAMDAFVTKPPSSPAPASSPQPAAISVTDKPPISTPEQKEPGQKELEQKLDDMKKTTLTRDEMKKVADDITQENKKAITEAAESTPPQSETEREADAQKKQQQLDRISSEIAFNTCGFQYWSYCAHVKQSTELQSEELTVAITSHKNKVEELKKGLFKNYHVKTAYYDNIVASAQQRVFNQLNTMHSNQERHESGVGTMDDMRARCDEIGRQWAVDPPGIEKEKPASDGGKGQGSAKGGNGQKRGRSGPQSNSGQGSSFDARTIGSGSGNDTAVTTTSTKPSKNVNPPLQEQPVYPEFK